MKKTIVLSFLSAAALFGISCTPGERGAVSGGALGAGVGYLIGDETGALIGGALGATVGSEMSKNRAHRNHQPYYNYPRPSRSYPRSPYYNYPTPSYSYPRSSYYNY